MVSYKLVDTRYNTDEECVLTPNPQMGEPFSYLIKITAVTCRLIPSTWTKNRALYFTVQKNSTKTGVLPFFFSLIYDDDGSGFVEGKGTKTDFWMHTAFWFLQPKIIAVFCFPLLLISLSQKELQKIKRPYLSYI